MRTRGPATLLLLLLITAVTACDRTPVDPLDDGDLATFAGPDGQRVSSLTLPGLLYSAIRRVHAEQGVAAAHDLVRDLGRMQYRLDEAASGERPGLRQDVRAEQLRIVLLVHGSDVVARALRGVSDEAAGLQQHRAALAASGIAVPEASAILDDLPVLLAQARDAETDLGALDAVTRAAARTDHMRNVIASAARLPALDDLFDDAARRLRDGALQHLVAEAIALRAEADDAVRSGDRDRAHRAASAARYAQIRLVLNALGPDAVADVIGRAQDRIREQDGSLRVAATRRDVSRLERMNAAARDMLRRADMSLRRGDSAGALDLAAHAVDLLNALEATLNTP
ncbi:MAG: hypothetical protein ACRELT_09305 [Longimicrobiales bacterium]